MTVPGHGTTTFGYDNVGRRISATAPTGGAMSFAWQSTLPIRTSWSGAHTVPGVSGTVTLDGTVERFYNDFLEVSELHVTGGKSVKLLRDNDGLVTEIADINAVFPTLTLSRSAIDGHVEGTTLDTVTTTHVLDVSETTPGFGDLLSVSANAGTTDLYDGAYTHDDRGRIATWTESLQGGASATPKFDYDAAGRLLTVHDITGGLPGTLLEEYVYDGNGNRQKAVSNYPGAVPVVPQNVVRREMLARDGRESGHAARFRPLARAPRARRTQVERGMRVRACGARGSYSTPCECERQALV